MGFRDYGFRWAPYVPVAQKRSKAVKFAEQVAKKQKRPRAPIAIKGRAIAKSFWGKAWCDNLEAYSDFSNRLPRGATYVRNGSVVDLVIQPGKVEAVVAGSNPYTVKITIADLAKQTWQKIKRDCSASIDSLLDLLGGRLSDGVMQRLTEKKGGCFPSPPEITMKCSCPDYSDCCKHIAAVMYGVGSRLDAEPELLFLLRGVDHQELVSQAVSRDNLDRELAASSSSLSGQDLGEMFGIELESTTALEAPKRSTRKSKTASPKKLSVAKTVSKRTVIKKPVAKVSATDKRQLAKAAKKKTGKKRSCQRSSR